MSSRAGSRVARLLTRTLGRTVWLTTRPRKQVCVFGWPDSEGNSFEMVVYLASVARERVVWLVAEPEGAAALLAQRNLDPQATGRVAIVRKNSLAGYRQYLCSAVVLFTHGLYSSDGPARGRTIVNLWHGDGPKRTENPAYEPRVFSDIVVGGTQLWGRQKWAYFQRGKGDLLVSGNPRIDQFAVAVPAEVLGALGLEWNRFIVWLPTYRRAFESEVQSWDDAPEIGAGRDLRALARGFEEIRSATGVRVVVKPHPLDRDSYERLGFSVITDQMINSRGTGLYSLLAASLALVTDYSSVWTDYLVTDKPIALFVPDLREYEEGRGLNVDSLASVAPGPLLASTGELLSFCESVGRGGDPQRNRRRQAVDAIGAVTEPGACERVWLGVAELAVTRGRAWPRAQAPASPVAGSTLLT
jgi:CDP-glycerol glycerophosphotransferase